MKFPHTFLAARRASAASRPVRPCLLLLSSCTALAISLSLLPRAHGGGDPPQRAATGTGAVLPEVGAFRLPPNKLDVEQVQAALAADHDPVWQHACQVAEKEAVALEASAPGLKKVKQQAHGDSGISAAKGESGVSLSLDPAKAAQECARDARLLLHVTLPAGRREIALTFDDGPHPRFTPRLLATLRACHAPATFFVVGKMAQLHPDLVREEVAQGFDVENHTYHHVSFSTLSTAQALAEIEAGRSVLKAVTGRSPLLFRPPGGRLAAEVVEGTTRMGMTTVLWTDDPGDYLCPPEQVILDRTLRGARNGGILLLHDGIPQTIDALPTLVASLRARGYVLVTASQLARDAVTSPAKNVKTR